MPWLAPTIHAQKLAIALKSAPKDLAPWLRPELFPPIAEPEEDDWPRGKGEPFEKYAASRPRMPNAEGSASKRISRPVRNCIYLQPLGDAATKDSFPCLDTLCDGVTAFYGMQCKVLPMITLKQLEASGKKPIRKRHCGKQVHAGDINANLVSRLPADGYTLCAVTMRDVWKGDFNFLFGLAFLTSGVGVFSFYRHQPNAPECEYFHGSLERQPGDEAVLLRRGFQTLTHELGHTFGLKHCVYFSCLMQGANSLEEAEGRMPDLCPVCLRKLLWVTRCESAAGARARYERLARFFADRSGFEKHFAWAQGQCRLGSPQAVDGLSVGGRTATTAAELEDVVSARALVIETQTGGAAQAEPEERAGEAEGVCQACDE